MTDLVGHVLLFAVLGVVFLLFPLILGLFVRPKNDTGEKGTAYECGEPAIGSSYVQFDLRFYVVALLFIIFDVEVAFFFPWAAIFGSATQLADTRLSPPARLQISEQVLNATPGNLAETNIIDVATANSLALTAVVDILVFFGVLLVGFAYVWKRGDLDWVRAMTEKKGATMRAQPPPGVVSDRKLEHVA